MTNRMLWMGIVATALAGAGLAGCAAEDKPKDDPAAKLQADLGKENGGLTKADEAPAFGIPELAAAPMFDPIGGEPGGPRPGTPGARNYRVALLWGHLPTGAPSPDKRAPKPERSWDMLLSVRAGHVQAYRTLSAGQGNFTFTHPTANDLAIVGRTGDGYAGAVLSVSVDAGAATTLFLSIDKGKVHEISLPALDESGGDALSLGDGVHGVKWAGFSEVPSCARGFAYGGWAEDPPHVGTLNGQLLDDTGARTGWIRGIWGYSRPAHESLFYAKRIDLRGGGAELAGGTFGGQRFDGKWGAASSRGGFVHGVYGDSPFNVTPPRGVWLGAWGAVCPK